MRPGQRESPTIRTRPRYDFSSSASRSSLLTPMARTTLSTWRSTRTHVRTCVRVERQVDNVVLAIGVRSDDRLADELKSYLGRVLIVGDSRCPGRIFNAVRDGFDTAWNL